MIVVVDTAANITKMIRSLPFALIIVTTSLFFSAYIDCIVLPHVVRVVGDARDMVGTFDLSESQSDRRCPGRIQHTAVEVPQPHRNVKMNRKQCVGDGSMKIYPEDTVDEAITMASAAVDGDAKAIVESIRDISKDISLLIFGIEEEGRSCGKNLRDNLDEGALIIVLRTSANTKIGISKLRDDFTYMIVAEPGLGRTCVYSTKYSANLKPSPISPSQPSTPADAPSTAPPTTGTTSTTTTTGSNNDEQEATITVEPNGDSTGSGDTSDVGGDSGSSDGSDDSDGFEAGVGSDSDNGSSDGTSDEDDDSLPADDSENEPKPSESPETVPETTEDDDPTCFPADASVTLEDGSFKRMDQLAIGDRVQVGNGLFSDVFMFTHKVYDTIGDFVTMSTASGTSLSATKGHYIYLNGQLVAARTAKVGDFLRNGSGNSEEIVKVSIEKKLGLFNPQTISGDIVVNNLQASTFTQAVEHCTAHALLTPIRWAYKNIGLTLAVLDNGADTMASYFRNGQAVA